MNKFTEHYSDLQQKQVAIINNEIELFNVSPAEYCQGFALEHVTTCLRGQSPINPHKIVDALWAYFFGEFDAAQFMPDAQGSTTYSDDDKLLVARIQKRMKERELQGQGIVSSTLAKRLGKSPGMISQLLNGKYAASPTKYLHEIWSLVEPADVDVPSQPAADEGKKPTIRIRYGEVPFVQTSVARLIKAACEHARDRRRFAVFAGQAGLGKSRGIERYIEENDQAILITGSEQTTSTQVLEELCIKLGISRSSSYKNMQKIVAALKDSDRIIILDEADKCKPNALDPLRTISDAARVGVVLVGNIQLIDKLQSQERFELISSRVCFWPKPVGEMPVDDIQTLFYELTQRTVALAEDDDKWWQWLHKRVEGNARLLVENLLPHVISYTRKNPDKKVDRIMVNSIFSTVLNKPTI
jgi:DNA transposition AAA+ family ATPase